MIFFLETDFVVLILLRLLIAVTARMLDTNFVYMNTVQQQFCQLLREVNNSNGFV